MVIRHVSGLVIIISFTLVFTHLSITVLSTYLFLQQSKNIVSNLIHDAWQTRALPVRPQLISRTFDVFVLFICFFFKYISIMQSLFTRWLFAVGQSFTTLIRVPFRTQSWVSGDPEPGTLLPHKEWQCYLFDAFLKFEKDYFHAGFPGKVQQ